MTVGEAQSTDVVQYCSTDGVVSLCVPIDDETVWATQAQMAELFGVNQRTLSEHLNNAYEEGEIARDSTYRKSRYVAADGKRRLISSYNLDAIITVGYRVKSRRGTEFRVWATRQLRDRMLLRAAPANDNGKLLAVVAELSEGINELRRELAGLRAGVVSAQEHKQMRSLARQLAWLECTARPWRSYRAALRDIDNELTQWTGWGTRGRPWRALPTTLVHTANAVLRGREASVRREMHQRGADRDLRAADAQMPLPEVPLEPEVPPKKETTH